MLEVSQWIWSFRREPDSTKARRGTLVSEMLKRLPLARVCEVAKFFQERFIGRAEARKIVQLVFLRKPVVEPMKGIRSFRAIALTAVMSKWYVTCVTLREWRKRSGRRSWSKCKWVEPTRTTVNIFKFWWPFYYTLGMAARTKRRWTETWVSTAPNNVCCQHGRQDRLWRG